MFKELFTESFWDKYVKKENTYYIVLDYIYVGRDEDQDPDDNNYDYITAQGDYSIYGKDGPIVLSQPLDIGWDAQGSAYALWDEYQLTEAIGNHISYDEKTDKFLEIDKIKYVKKPNRKATDSMTVEAVVTMKEED